LIFRKMLMAVMADVYAVGTLADFPFSHYIHQDTILVPYKVNAGVNASCTSSLTCPIASAYLVVQAVDVVHALVL
jgi:hypothetical protein